MSEENSRLKKSVLSWLDSRTENLDVDGVSMTPQEAREHILQGTPRGEEILDKITETTVTLFKTRRS